nr:TetR/AcrR family transcriptional regulator [uncultured Cellulosilyticum sp.]
MGKAEENKRKKQEALFNTAFELFSTKGINNTAINDIVEKAGVAKGTFYLYFKDKYDIRDKLIIRKTTALFGEALKALNNKETIESFPEQVIFVIDHVIEDLRKDKFLVKMISKDLSWGVYKKALTQMVEEEDKSLSFYHMFMKGANSGGTHLGDPEVTLFLIVELVGSTAYSSILLEQPKPIDELKPHLYQSIRKILEVEQIKE